MKLYVVGIGPGGKENLTYRAISALEESQVIVGYGPYLEYVKDFIEGKETIQSGMRAEIERCKAAIDSAKSGKITSIISTGDAGLYGMAGPILELIDDDLEHEIIPGVPAHFSAASDLGAPLMDDGANISLSDLLTPYDLIMERVRACASADMIISLYNPRSKGRTRHLPEAIGIIKKYRDGSTPVGIVRDSGRPGTRVEITNLDQIDFEKVDMKTMVIVGNSKTMVKNGRIITPRGYDL